jgi:hypothetical protein
MMMTMLMIMMMIIIMMMKMPMQMIQFNGEFDPNEMMKMMKVIHNVKSG